MLSGYKQCRNQKFFRERYTNKRYKLIRFGCVCFSFLYFFILVSICIKKKKKKKQKLQSENIA